MLKQLILSILLISATLYAGTANKENPTKAEITQLTLLRLTGRNERNVSGWIDQ